MQARADSDEVASGRRLVTKKTRAVLRLFGARAGAALGGTNFVSGGGFAGAGGGGGFEGGGGFPLGYSAGIQGFDMFTKQKLPKSGV